MTRCWLAEHGIYERGEMPPCEGQLVKVHLISRQRLKRAGLGEFIDDPRVWVPACGGINGSSAHHGMLDVSRTLRIPRSAIPAGLEEFAERYGVRWVLDRDYGPSA